MNPSPNFLDIGKIRNRRMLFCDLRDYLISEDALLLKALALWSLSLLAAAFVLSYTIGVLPRPENSIALRHQFEGGKWVALLASSLLPVVAMGMLTLVANHLLLLRHSYSAAPSKRLFSALHAGMRRHAANYLLNFVFIYVLYLGARYLIGFGSGFVFFGPDVGLDMDPFNELFNFLAHRAIGLFAWPLVFY